jgi:outer membrane biosynthesis protein TonB
MQMHRIAALSFCILFTARAVSAESINNNPAVNKNTCFDSQRSEQFDKVANDSIADQSPEMKSAWNKWHNQVTATVWERFWNRAKATFGSGKPALSATIKYEVTSSGQILNIQFTHKSSNEMFNKLVLDAVESVSKDPILTFPSGSVRTSTMKFAMFHNQLN